MKTSSRIMARGGLTTLLSLWLSGFAITSAFLPTDRVHAASPSQLGDPAPDFQIAEWVQGQPFQLSTNQNPNRIVVVDFWATWCGPCKVAIPHLNQLAHEIAKSHPTHPLQIVGISKEPLASIQPFVRSMGSNMNYAVAHDLNGATTKDYMVGFQIRSLPHVFVVNAQNKIVWHGHALGQLKQVLEEVIAGTWNIEKAQKVIQAEDALQQYLVVAAVSPQSPEVQRLGQTFLQNAWDSPELLNNGASAILSNPRLPQRDWSLARDAADRAVTLTKRQNAAMLDTLAQAFEGLKDRPQAVRIQQEAIDRAPDKSARDAYLKRLQEYRKSNTSDR